MASQKNLKIISKISQYTGFTSLCYSLNKNRKRTIAYHNIIPDRYWDDSIHLAHSMKESSFSKQIEVIQNRFEIDLDINNANTATITFDDGYLNQYIIASKILDKKNVNGYFFCVADLINNKETLDMDMIQYWISYVPAGSYTISEINLNLFIKSHESRLKEWNKISEKLNQGVKLSDMKKYLNNTFSFEFIKKLRLKTEMYRLRFEHINLEDIEILKKKGHKIGAHSAKHLRLSKLSDEELEEDIEICKENIDHLYNTKVFCYPYGSKDDISEKVISLLSENGFTNAFAYTNGYLNGMKYNKYFIPRMFIPDTDDKDVIDFVLSGAKHFISFRRLLPKIGSGEYGTIS